LRTPPHARIFEEGSVLIAASTSAPAAREARLRAAGAEVLRFPSVKGRVNLVLLLKELARREVSHVLVEGGGETVASALKAGAIDRLHLIMAPKLIGGRLAPSSIGGAGIRSLDNAVRLANLSLRRLGEDILVTADLTGPKGR
jgi:diaminohydroxyphosphoribosylaminopyrimidine deaminase/5-amino-6-(5-phosphoribosylamino)uracil reductase